jgi:hypothetical protein
MEYLFGRCRTRIPSVIGAVFVAASLLPSAVAAADGGVQEDPEYLERITANAARHYAEHKTDDPLVI